MNKAPLYLLRGFCINCEAIDVKRKFKAIRFCAQHLTINIFKISNRQRFEQ